MLGKIAYHANRLDDAERYVRQGLTYDSTDYTCLFSLGRILMALRRPQEALRYNKAALEQWSDDALANQDGLR
jgi:tetratricopeptide (TPR) repeat protein